MVKLVVDSASDIDKEEAEALGIALLPIQVRFGTEEYLDGVTLSHEEFFEKLVEDTAFPQTSQINESRWEEAFEELTKDGSAVIAITLSSKLSGTYHNAAKAAKKFGGKVFAVDSLNASIGEKILCEYALSLIRQEVPASEIVKSLNEIKQKIQVLAVLDTLKYLKKGGRISSVTAFAGELLSIKPVISIVGGEVKVVGKAMGSRKGNNLLVQLVQKCGGIDFTLPYTVGFAGLDDSYMKKYLADSAALWQDKTDRVPAIRIGSTIGAHIGPGGVAVAFFAAEKK